MAFEATIYMLHAEARAAKALQVFHRRRLRDEALADQATIWFEVRRKQHEAATYSPTGALHDVSEHHRHEIGSYPEAFELLPNRVGAVFVVAAQLSAGTVRFVCSFCKMFPKLLGSYALSAITSRRCEERPVHISERKRS